MQCHMWLETLQWCPCIPLGIEQGKKRKKAQNSLLVDRCCTHIRQNGENQHMVEEKKPHKHICLCSALANVKSFPWGYVYKNEKAWGNFGEHDFIPLLSSVTTLAGQPYGNQPQFIFSHGLQVWRTGSAGVHCAGHAAQQHEPLALAWTKCGHYRGVATQRLRFSYDNWVVGVQAI